MPKRKKLKNGGERLIYGRSRAELTSSAGIGV